MTTTISIPANASKEEAFTTVETYLNSAGLSISTIDKTRPWGGFFCIGDGSTEDFIGHFFADIPDQDIRIGERLSPKILLVESGKRLSWQYHHRRSEIWKVVSGTVQVVKSDTDEQTHPETKKQNDVIVLNKGQRHRLIGTGEWGVIAEIWQHTDNMPSDENDIVRVEDDFGR